MAEFQIALANGRAVLLWPSLKMNVDETVSSLVGQREICRMRSPRWIPDVWIHQVQQDQDPSEPAAAGS
jgi:hypothetical protein